LKLFGVLANLKKEDGLNPGAPSLSDWAAFEVPRLMHQQFIFLALEDKQECINNPTSKLHAWANHLIYF
jgi:hypothetical protein